MTLSHTHMFTKSPLGNVKHINFDLDDTLFDTAGGLRRILLEDYGLTDLPPTGVYLTDEQTNGYLSKVLSSNWFHRVNLIPEITPLIDLIPLAKENGFSVGACTHRPPTPAVIKGTIDSIIKSGLPFDYIHFLSQPIHPDKIDWLRLFHGNDDTILFDDWPSRHVSKMTAYKNLYLISNVSNEHINVVNRITTSDIVSHFKRLTNLE